MNEHEWKDAMLEEKAGMMAEIRELRAKLDDLVAAADEACDALLKAIAKAKGVA